MNFENVDALMDRYSLLLQIRYNNGNNSNIFLENEIFNTRQRLIAQQVSSDAMEALEERYKVK